MVGLVRHLVFFACSLLSWLSGAQTIAFVDIDKVLEQMQGYVSTLSEITGQSSYYQAVLDSVQQQIDLKYKKLEVERFLLTDPAIHQREKEIGELQKKKSDMLNSYFGSDGFMVTSRKKFVQPYLDKVMKVIQDYAVEKGIDIVLDRKKQNNIIFASPALDKTKEIIDLLRSAE